MFSFVDVLLACVFKPWADQQLKSVQKWWTLSIPLTLAAHWSLTSRQFTLKKTDRIVSQTLIVMNDTDRCPCTVCCWFKGCVFFWCLQWTCYKMCTVLSQHKCFMRGFFFRNPKFVNCQQILVIIESLTTSRLIWKVLELICFSLLVFYNNFASASLWMEHIKCGKDAEKTQTQEQSLTQMSLHSPLNFVFHCGFQFRMTQSICSHSRTLKTPALDCLCHPPLMHQWATPNAPFLWLILKLCQVSCDQVITPSNWDPCFGSPRTTHSWSKWDVGP